MVTSRRSATTQVPLTFSSAEPLVSPSALQEDERDWMTRVVTWQSSFFDLLAECAPAGWFGRTSTECSLSMAVLHSERSLSSWSSAGMASRGECSTLNISACPRDDVASSLSDILETGDHLSRYFLSARACRGILERAARRGRQLPSLLEQALIEASRGR